MNLPHAVKKYWQLGELKPSVFIEIFLSPQGKLLTPNGPQKGWMENGTKDINVWAAGNSTGKSWGEAFKHLWFAVYKKRFKNGQLYQYKSAREYLKEPYETLCTAPDYKQAMIVWQHIESFLQSAHILNLNTWVKNITVATRRDPHARIELNNGAVIHATSTALRGKHIEGGAYDFISVDEPADEQHLSHVVERVLKPRTFKRGGVIDLVGTPKGPGEFFDYWRTGMKFEKDGYYNNEDGVENSFYKEAVYSQTNDAMENPYASRETMEKFKELSDDDLIKERIHGMFVDTGESVFRLDGVEAMMVMEEEELPETNGRYRTYERGHEYVGGADFGQVDSSVFTILDVSYVPYQLVVQEEYANHSWEYIFAKFLELHKAYEGKVNWQIDATSMGGSMQEEWTRNLGIPFRPFVYSPVSKVKLINTLQEVLSLRKIISPVIPELREQLRFYKLDPKTRRIDDAKLKTDRIQALALATELAEKKKSSAEFYYYGRGGIEYGTRNYPS